MKELKQFAQCEFCDKPIDTTQTLPGQIHIAEKSTMGLPAPVEEAVVGPTLQLSEAPHVQAQKSEADVSGYYCRPACLIAKVRELGPAKPARAPRKGRRKASKKRPGSKT